jgi:PTS system nitrogen regulatory IIA component
MHLGVHDVARLLAVSEKTIYRWIQQGQLPAYKVNDQYRFNQAELLEWANAQKINVSVEMFQEPDTSAELMPDLADAIEAGGIFYRVAGTDKGAVLRSVVEVMKLPPDMDRDFLHRVLLAREAMASTGVGDGVAIPHVRNPIVLSVNHPAICLCFLEKPIEFGAIDEQPVHTLFTLVTPTVRIHLYLLSRLASALLDPTVKAALHRQASRDEILAALRALKKVAPVDSGVSQGVGSGPALGQI